MKYHLVAADSGNILGVYPTPADALRPIENEIRAGGSVDDLAVLAVEPGITRVVAEGSEVAANLVRAADPGGGFIYHGTRPAPLGLVVTVRGASLTVQRIRHGGGQTVAATSLSQLRVRVPMPA